MVGSALASCRGSPCSTSASGSTSPASPCQAAELTGHSHGREGWGCELESKPCLLEAKQAGPAPSRQGWRVPRPRFAACGLDRLSPARQGLAKQVSLDGKRNASDSGKGIALVANYGPRVRKQRSNFALVTGCRRIGVHVTAAGRAGPNIFHCGQPCSERNQ